MTTTTTKRRVKKLVSIFRNYSSKKLSRIVYRSIYYDRYVEISKTSDNGWTAEFVANGQVKHVFYCNVGYRTRLGSKAEFHYVHSLKQIISAAKRFLLIQHFSKSN